MVGDPRQAIYAFRGGDMATYRKAERECLELHNGRKYGLVQNFRSSAPVIRAVNAIFHDHPFPFADPDITFSEIQAPADDSGKQRAGIQFHGREEPAPLKFTWLPPENRDPTAAQLADRTIRLCAKQIRKMLDDPAIRLPDRESPGVMPETSRYWSSRLLKANGFRRRWRNTIFRRSLQNQATSSIPSRRRSWKRFSMRLPRLPMPGSRYAQ